MIVAKVTTHLRALAAAVLFVVPVALAAQQQAQTAEIEVIADSVGQPILVNGRQMGLTPATMRIQPASGVRLEVGRTGRTRSLTLDVAPSARMRVEFTMPRDTQPLPPVRAREVIERQLLASSAYPMPRQPVAPVQPRRPGVFGSLVLGGALIGGAAFAGSSGACEQSFTSPAPSGGYVGGTYYPPGQHSLGVLASCQMGAAGVAALVGSGVVHVIRRGGYNRRSAAYTAAQARFAQAQAEYQRQVQEREDRIRTDVQRSLDQDQERRQAVATANDRAIRANRELPLVTFFSTARGQVSGGRTSMVPPRLQIASVQFADTDGDSVISAGEPATVRVRLQNSGQGVAVGVMVEAATSSRLGARPTEVGVINPGEVRDVIVPLRATLDVEDEQAALNIKAVEANGFDSDPLQLTVPVLAYRPPNLQILGARAVDANGQTIITPGTQAKVTVRVQNTGGGKADSVRVTIARGENMFFADDPSATTVVRQLGQMRPGEFKDVDIDVITNNRATAFPLTASVQEASGRYDVPSRDLGLQLNRASRGMAQVVAVQAPRPTVGTVTAGTFGSDLLQGIPRVSENPNAIAVIIGNSQYQGDIPAVQFAANDAAVMRQYAEQALGVRPANILMLNNATMSQLRTVFGERGNPNGRLRNLIRPGVSEVFVFYSGHGAPDAAEAKAYIMPTDADASLLSLTGYAVDVLYENLSAIGAKHVTVVLDACFSGATGGGQMLIRSASPIGIQVNDPAQRFQGGNATIIAAAEGQQLANWYDEKNHGLLTYMFLKGLQGGADKDQNGEVSVEEMRAFLTDQAYGVPYEARRLHNRDQTPQVFGAGDWTLRPRAAAAGGGRQ